MLIFVVNNLIAGSLKEIFTFSLYYVFFSADSEDSTVSIQIKLENEGSDEELETDVLYSPQIALKLALTEWLSEFGVPHQYNSNCHYLPVVRLK